MASPIELVPSALTDPDAAELISELNGLLNDLYHPDDNHFRLDPGEVAGGRGIFLVARIGKQAVGCGALRMTDDGRAEVKRMYVRPSAQGRGVGRAILARLEEEARGRGATAMILEMGGRQPAARALYEAAGFTPVPCWGEYLATPTSRCLGKELSGPEPA